MHDLRGCEFGGWRGRAGAARSPDRPARADPLAVRGPSQKHGAAEAAAHPRLGEPEVERVGWRHGGRAAERRLEQGLELALRLVRAGAGPAPRATDVEHAGDRARPDVGGQLPLEPHTPTAEPEGAVAARLRVTAGEGDDPVSARLVDAATAFQVGVEAECEHLATLLEGDADVGFVGLRRELPEQA